LCGVDTFEFFPCEDDVNNLALMEWQQYALQVVGKDKASNESRRFKLEYMKTTPSVCIDYLKPKIDAFIEHNFFAKWQDIQFKNLLKNIPQDVVYVMNFVENYGFKVQNEVLHLWIGTPCK
jgi:hypothetical protein